jgi:aminopeptidase
VDHRVEKLARVLVDYSTAVTAGDLVLVEAAPPAAPLVRAVHRLVLEAGAHPRIRTVVEGLAESILTHGTDAQLDWVNPSRYVELETVDVRIHIMAETNTRALSGVDPARQARLGKAYEQLRNLSMARAAAGELRWCVTLFPTQASAQDAEMSLADYEDFVYAAGKLDLDDPVAAWRSFGEEIERLAGWLATTRELRLVADGTDLTVGVEGRAWIPSEGRENFPDGECFTGPVETSLEGEISFGFPAAYGGRSVEGVRLVFRGGEVVEATAAKGEEFLRQMLAVDDGARRAGEFAFGLNWDIGEHTRNTLFDEKIGGTVHLALGKSYPETGGVNASALHWDLVCDLRRGSEVYADGELVYRDGRFLDSVAAAS